jgi:hypothetical protein
MLSCFPDSVSAGLKVRPALVVLDGVEVGVVGIGCLVAAGQPQPIVETLSENVLNVVMNEFGLSGSNASLFCHLVSDVEKCFIFHVRNL